MTKKFFETPEYASARREWYAKLKKDGFTDLENPENPDDFIQPEIINMAGGRGPAAEDYFDYCQRLLRDYPFDVKHRAKWKMYRAIFELHAEGRPEREIADWLERASAKDPDLYQKVSHIRVHQIIRTIKENFGRLA